MDENNGKIIKFSLPQSSEENEDLLINEFINVLKNIYNKVGIDIDQLRDLTNCDELDSQILIQLIAENCFNIGITLGNCEKEKVKLLLENICRDFYELGVSKHGK